METSATRRCQHNRACDDWCPECEIDERDQLIESLTVEIEQLQKQIASRDTSCQDCPMFVQQETEIEQYRNAVQLWFRYQTGDQGVSYTDVKEAMIAAGCTGTTKNYDRCPECDGTLQPHPEGCPNRGPQSDKGNPIARDASCLDSGCDKFGHKAWCDHAQLDKDNG